MIYFIWNWSIITKTIYFSTAPPLGVRAGRLQPSALPPAKLPPPPLPRLEGQVRRGAGRRLRRGIHRVGGGDVRRAPLQGNPPAGDGCQRRRPAGGGGHVARCRCQRESQGVVPLFRFVKIMLNQLVKLRFLLV